MNETTGGNILVNKKERNKSCNRGLRLRGYTVLHRDRGGGWRRKKRMDGGKK